MIGARQIKAARALAGLSQQDVASRAGIGIATMRRIEAAIDEVIGSAQTLSRIQKALEAEGIKFIDQDEQGGLGVRLRNQAHVTSRKARRRYKVARRPAG